MKPFEIFKPGTHTSAEGETLSFADSDLTSIAGGYDPALHHAPICVGHPKQDAPAYGWVDKLEVRSGRLVAVPADLDAEFSDLVKGGKFRKVSAAFYPPSSANNPKPGSWYLRHVGFLGAAAPAVKGLKPVAFADDAGTVFADIDFADGASSWTLESFARMLRGIRDYFVEKEGVETAEKMLPQWHLDDVIREAAEMRARDTPRLSFTEPTDKETDMTKEELAAAAAELAAREKAMADRETAFAESARAARATADAALVADVVKQGRLPIGLQAQATVMFADLSDNTVSFADGDATVEMSPRAAFADLLAKLPVPVVTGELAKGESVDFSDADAVSSAIQTEMEKAKAAGKDISPVEAAARLQKG